MVSVRGAIPDMDKSPQLCTTLCSYGFAPRSGWHLYRCQLFLTRSGDRRFCPCRGGRPFQGSVGNSVGKETGWRRKMPQYQVRKVDRRSVVEGKRVSVRVDLGGRRIIKKKIETQCISN